MSSTIKPGIKTTLRMILTIIVLLNAVVPTAALARPSVPAESVVPEQPQILNRAQGFQLEHIRERAGFSFPASLAEDEQFPSVNHTVDLARFDTEIAAPAPMAATSPIQFEFSASPAQANPGDSILFTVTISNTGDDPVTGLIFSNVLPAELASPSSADPNFKFDAETNTITWGGEAPVEAGETITFIYTAVVDSQIHTDIQVADEANLFVPGEETPLTATAELGIFPLEAEKEFTALGTQGGEAEGLDGLVVVDIPSGELGKTDGILIEDLSEEFETDGSAPFLIFQIDVVSQNQLSEGVTTPAPVLETATPTVLPTSTAEPAEIEQTSTPVNETEEVQSEEKPESESLQVDTIPAEDATAEITATVTALPLTEIPTETSTPTVTPTATDQPNDIEPSPTSTPTVEPQPLPQEDDSAASLEAKEEQFNKPVEITVSFDGITDLSSLGAEYVPYLVTLDEDSGVWVKMPIETVDPEANTITAEVNHFSIWGAGVGATNIVTSFNNPYPALFTGSSHYSIPIWTPPGRNGMAPDLTLSYSSAAVDGIIGDIQAPWVGMGWNIDTVEIARQITNGACSPSCGTPSYGYSNKFVLLFNGTGYVLIPDGTTPGRYHTKSESFLYIQLHNEALGNNSPAAENTSHEWWEVIEKGGTRWRLGWKQDSEQLAAMLAYTCTTGSPCTTPAAPYASLGYAGVGQHVVAGRWRADLVTDTHDNTMTLSYFEEATGQPVPPACAGCMYDRSSYLETISYTGTTSDSLLPAYSVNFVRGSRAHDIPALDNNWDNADYFLLDRIDVKYGATVVRSYDLNYEIIWDNPTTPTYSTMELSSVTISGGGISAPPTTFTYINQYNRASCGAGCNRWYYPRLESVSNGTGGELTYTYGNDGRPNTSWYNWRVTSLDVSDGVTSNPMKTTFAYTTPCYKAPSTASANPTLNWTCNGTNLGALVGYAQTTATTMDFDGSTVLGSSVHQFYTDEQKAGREYVTQNKDETGNTLSQTSTIYTVVTSGLPATGYFTYVSRMDQSLNSSVRRTDYEYDTVFGNLTRVKDFIGGSALYRQTDFQYVTNTAPSIWILNTVSRQILKDAAGVSIIEQRFGYDGATPGSGTPTVGELTLSQQVNLTTNQTIDTEYAYDSYGNLEETLVYESYGIPGSLPTSPNYLTYVNGYDPLKTYVISSDGPMIPATTTEYDYGLGLPISATDPNGNEIITEYDGLGRVTQVTYADYSQPNVKYTYPTNPVSAPFKMKVEVWDEDANTYRTVWQIMDGLGRVIQTQEPYEASGSSDNLVLNDTAYNAQGLVKFSGMPRTLNGTGGNYSLPTWAGPYTQTNYDALGRVTSVAYPDASQEVIGYSNLRKTIIDRNNHQKVQETDIFGRLVKVEEYTGSGSYSLYATTVYEYDLRDLLKKVIDAQGNQTLITYNGFGRKESMTDPDMGYWTYGYDVLGNLTSQTDARTCVTTVVYDDLNRPTQKTYSGPGACDGTPDVSYTYDSTVSGNEGLGQRTGMTDGSGSTSWVYGNTLGPVEVEQSKTVDGIPYLSSSTSDALSRPLTQTLASGEVLDYDYNAMGSLSSLSGTGSYEYVSQIQYYASGQVKSLQLGNDLLQQFCYQADTLRLASARTYPGSEQSCVVANPASARLNFSYDYQPNGNVSQMVDATQNETINYSYDELDRLLNVNGPYHQSYNYNLVGNMAARSSNTLGLSSVSVGGNHACALTAVGGVKCWGANFKYQLGDGTQISSSSPVDVIGLTSGVEKIATGYSSTCAIITSGGAKCWGDNSKGQLGDGTTVDRSSPVNVNGLTSGVASITLGFDYACALTTSGGVKCWGDNTYGQLGDGTLIAHASPADVSGLTTGVVAISAGRYHTCALLSTGGVKCWGWNPSGVLGDGTNTQRTTPVDVSGLTSGVSMITTGDAHSCAMTTTGGIKCWGDNTYGQLGDGTTTVRYTPTDVTGLTSGVTRIDAGSTYSCALTSSAGVKCWGDNMNGQLGNDSSINSSLPVDVNGLLVDVDFFSSGDNSSCALTTYGAMKCWGDNTYGQLGNGLADRAFFLPTNVGGLGSGVTAVAASDYYGVFFGFTCAITTSGGVKCWGANSTGQLGDGTNINRKSPVDVIGLTSGVTAITAGYRFACALTNTGTVKCWGDGSNGQLGNGAVNGSNVPVSVNINPPVGVTVTAISAGGKHACALLSNGAVKCWGYNNFGQVGDNTVTQRSTPAFVYGFSASGATAVTTGEHHSCLVTTGGAAKCWGYNGDGALGNNSTTNSKMPVTVSNLIGITITALAAGRHTCALTSTGAVKCWGSGHYGQLGNGTTTSSNVPVGVIGITNNAIAISASYYHTCALINTGVMKCWGNSSSGGPNGQLGDGNTTTSYSSLPVTVSGLYSGVTSIGVGGEHNCAIVAVVLKCWGNNVENQVGRALIPVDAGTQTSAETTYTYGDSAHKHAVTALSTGETYTYDANGNMITRVEGGETYTQTFDAENRLASVTVNSQTTQFIYDGDGVMVKQINPDGSKLIMIGGVYQETRSAANALTEWRVYYPAGGAMRVHAGTDDDLYFVHKDHLGSASVVTDDAGNIVDSQRYMPYGEPRLAGTSLPTDRLFTGQRDLPTLGLMDYKARMYSLSLGRFIQPDTIVPDLLNPQSWNRYSYTVNNPIRYNDPTGHSPFVTPKITCDLDCWRAQHQDDEGAPPNDHFPPNPFQYDTLTFGFKGLLKKLVGLEADVEVNINLKALRNLNLRNFDASVGLGGYLSGGLAAEDAVGAYFYGHEGSVLDQSSFYYFGKDGQASVNIGGCFEHICPTALYTFDGSEDGVSGEGFFIGAGLEPVALDLSVDLVGGSDFIFYGNNQTGEAKWQVPFLNYRFIETIFN